MVGNRSFTAGVTVSHSPLFFTPCASQAALSADGPPQKLLEEADTAFALRTLVVASWWS